MLTSTAAASAATSAGARRSDASVASVGSRWGPGPTALAVAALVRRERAKCCFCAATRDARRAAGAPAAAAACASSAGALTAAKSGAMRTAEKRRLEEDSDFGAAPPVSQPVSRSMLRQARCAECLRWLCSHNARPVATPRRRTTRSTTPQDPFPGCNGRGQARGCPVRTALRFSGSVPLTPACHGTRLRKATGVARRPVGGAALQSAARRRAWQARPSAQLASCGGALSTRSPGSVEARHERASANATALHSVRNPRRGAASQSRRWRARPHRRHAAPGVAGAPGARRAPRCATEAALPAGRRARRDSRAVAAAWCRRRSGPAGGGRESARIRRVGRGCLLGSAPCRRSFSGEPPRGP